MISGVSCAKQIQLCTPYFFKVRFIRTRAHSAQCVVPKRGLEPLRPKPLPPQGSASTNSATWAKTRRSCMQACMNISIVMLIVPFAEWVAQKVLFVVGLLAVELLAQAL